MTQPWSYDDGDDAYDADLTRRRPCRPIVEIDESNGAVEVVTHGIIKSNYGATDTVNLDAAAAPIHAGANSYEKAHRWHVTAMGGAVSVRAFRFYATPPAANAAH